MIRPNHYNKELLSVIRKSKRIYLNMRLSARYEIQVDISKNKAMEICKEHLYDSNIIDYVVFDNGDLLLGY